MIKNPNVLKFIHLTDPHVTAPGVKAYGGNPVERLRAAIDSINEEHGDADFAVITGDLAHRGADAAYQLFAREIARLSVPVHLLMGNHDDPRVFRFYFPDTQRCEHGFIQGSKRTPFGLCLFLDTWQQGTGTGGYCARRSAWLEGVLAETDGPVMLFMHHPPFEIGIPVTDASALEDAARFWTILAPHRARIRHLFFGHVHRPVFGSWRGIPVSAMRGLNHQVALDMASASHGERQRGTFEPPAYGVVLVDSERVIAHMHDFMDCSERFRF